MDFPGNSKNIPGGTPLTPKEVKPEKNVQKVVSVTAVQKKPSIHKRVKTLFFGGEFKSATSYVLGDVLLPAMKNMALDALSKGGEKLIFGDQPRRRYEPGRPRYSYNNPVERYSRPGILPDQPPRYSSIPRRQEVGEIILISREEADLVLERLTDIIDTYQVASVADLHELVGLPHSHIDQKWGWTMLRGASVRQTRDGYLIDLPPAESI